MKGKEFHFNNHWIALSFVDVPIIYYLKFFLMDKITRQTYHISGMITFLSDTCVSGFCFISAKENKALIHD